MVLDIINDRKLHLNNLCNIHTMGGLYDAGATNRNRDDLLEGFGATRLCTNFLAYGHD